MNSTRRPSTFSAFVALLGGASLLAACGGEAAPTGAEGAVGEVEAQSPNAPESSLAAADGDGGPAGQAPTTGAAAAPSVEVSQGDQAPSSASSDNAPMPTSKPTP